MLIALVITGTLVPAELPDSMLSTITMIGCSGGGAVAGVQLRQGEKWEKSVSLQSAFGGGVVAQSALECI